MADAGLKQSTIIVLAPEGRDSSVLRALLAEAGIDARVDTGGEQLFRALKTGTAAGAVLTDEALTKVGMSAFRSAIEEQPTWSDFPFVILARRAEGLRERLFGFEEIANATILERPLHPASLVSAVRSAIRSRNRQLLAAKHLRDLDDARGELRALADSLESKVRERTRDLASANDRLTKEIAEREKAEARLVQAQKMEAVGQLTGGIAHDFNNLLTAVIGSLDLLVRRSDDERLTKLAKNALHAAERGAELTSQMLAFSRRQRLSPVPLNINDTLLRLRDLLGRSLGPRVNLKTNLESSLWLAMADPTQLEMMILNLAINARDAMPSGGRLEISTGNIAEVPVELESDLKPGEYVCIRVRDTGVGMSPEIAERVFEPFFTTKQPGKGTGLGLSQLYGFARQSGGTVRLETSEGEGTTVTVYLPRTKAKPEAADAEDERQSHTYGARLLLVDDDNDVRTAASAMMEELGYSVTAVPRAMDAVDLVETHDFDLLVTDVMMPVMNGVELANKIRAIAPEMPVLFATGYADIEEFGTELEGVMLVRKPFRMAELASKIESALRGDGAHGDVVDFDKARRERDLSA